ncbi:hypothetical protein [Streptomyces abikoensis]|uniref:Uncharacterized protein n=1 Tax=Streptomyces abikoensis TaxID=97398 RepID=A0ABW7SVW4_9ACTN
MTWLDQVKEAAPNSIDRRITGVAGTARRSPYNVTVPKDAALAARQLVKRFRNDPARMARGRGKAATIAPAELRKINTADSVAPRKPGSRRRRSAYAVPELARLRNRAMHTLRFAIAGRNEEMSELDDPYIKLVAEGLDVHVPSVKGRPLRDVVVAYGEHPDSCPVRCGLAWQQAKLAGATSGGPAYLPVDQRGNLGTQRMSPEACGCAITRDAQRAGLDAHVTGHSGRRSLVTTGRKKGKRPEKLRQQGAAGLRSPPVFWEYVDEGERGEDAANEDSGLPALTVASRTHEAEGGFSH